MGNLTLTGTLPPAAWRVKRSLPGQEAGEDQTVQTDGSAPAMRAPTCRQAVRIEDGEVVEEGLRQEPFGLAQGPEQIEGFSRAI